MPSRPRAFAKLGFWLPVVLAGLAAAAQDMGCSATAVGDDGNLAATTTSGGTGGNTATSTASASTTASGTTGASVTVSTGGATTSGPDSTGGASTGAGATTGSDSTTSSSSTTSAGGSTGASASSTTSGATSTGSGGTGPATAGATSTGTTGRGTGATTTGTTGRGTGSTTTTGTTGRGSSGNTTAGARDAGSDATLSSDAPPPTGKVTLWMAGDSTMQPCTTACPCGWGSQFDPYFNDNVTVVNSAAGGRSIQTWLYDPNVSTTTMNAAGECVVSPETYSTRWQAMLNATTGMKAGDYLFVQFGINDGDSTCDRHVGSARYQELLGVMAQAAQARGAHPIFLTAVSAISCKGSVAGPSRGFLTDVAAAATANNVPVIDLHKLSYTLYNTLMFCPNNADYTAGALGAFFCNDHTHFESAGAVQIAGLVANALRDQAIPLAAYLK